MKTKDHIFLCNGNVVRYLKTPPFQASHIDKNDCYTKMTKDDHATLHLTVILKGIVQEEA